MQLLNHVLSPEMLRMGLWTWLKTLRSKPNSTRRETVGIVAALLALVLLPAPVTSGQVAGGSISGTVRGESGDAIPGVQVSITNAPSNAARTVITDSDGFYNAPDL